MPSLPTWAYALPWTVLGGLSMVADLGSTWGIVKDAALGLMVGAFARSAVDHRYVVAVRRWVHV